MQRSAAALALQLLQQSHCSASLFSGSMVSALETQLLPASGHHTQQLLVRQHEQHSSISSPAWCFSNVRHMAGRTHTLSLKWANNKASWAAAKPFLKQQPQQAAAAAAKPRPIQTAIPELPRLQEPPQYRRIGKITGPYSITPQAAFAVVESGGAQFKVTADDVIYHNKIPNVQVNDVLELGKVLLVGTQQETTIGRPFIPGASIIAAVEETLKDSKVHVFKKKKRKGYTKLQGHRSHITALRILELRAPGMQQVPAASSSSSSSTVQAAAPPVRSIGRGRSHGPPAIMGISGIGPTSSSGNMRQPATQQLIDHSQLAG